MSKLFLISALFILPLFIKAQNNIGIGTSTPDANAILDVTSTSKGLLLPRMALTATNAASPLTAFVAGMVVYNTATAGSAPNNVVPGYYYSDGTQWLRVLTQTSGWSITGNAGTNPAINFIGTTDDKDLVFVRNNVRAGLINAGAGNTSWGSEALNPATTSGDNTANGYKSLYSNTTGHENTANGNLSLYLNTTGAQNTANGARALYTNTTGDGNTAYGYHSLSANVGSRNTAQGYNSLANNTTGNDNVAVGIRALLNNNTGYSNVAVGVNSLYNNIAQSNLVAVGDSALYNNNGGFQNTAIGSKALYGNVGGISNTAVGYNTLYSNNSGYDNTATGLQALYSNTGGHENTANGLNALNKNQTGSLNTAIGDAALLNNVSGSGNVAIGYQAGSFETGSNKLYISNYNSDANNSLVYGQFSGTTATQLLQVNGKLKVNMPDKAVGLDMGSAAVVVNTSTASVNPFVFTVTATAATLDLVIPNTTQANSPNDILIVTHRLTSNKLGTSPGVYWNGSNWVIFFENSTNHIVGEKYNVMVIKTQ